jgi:7-cyano-7-deazaguanine synthase
MSTSSQSATELREEQALVLLSGGIDSTACAHFMQQRTTTVRALFINYGQVSGPREERAAQDVAAYYDIPLQIVRCIGVERKSAGLIRGRNGFFVFLALMEARMDAGIIVSGIHDGTRYWDCGREFVESIQHVIDGYTGGKIRVSLPFLSWSKRDIWDFCQASKVPVNLTYSCEQGGDQPCEECDSCRDLKMLYAC